MEVAEQTKRNEAIAQRIMQHLAKFNVVPSQRELSFAVTGYLLAKSFTDKPTVPNGWVMVPKKLTLDMKTNAEKHGNGYWDGDYAALIDSVPAAPTQSEAAVRRKALEDAMLAAGAEFISFENFKNNINRLLKDGYKNGMGGFNINCVEASQRAMHRVQALIDQDSETQTEGGGK
jgi:hypothetical protein